MYRLLTGKQRGLVFPVLCNAHIKIDYSDNIPLGADGIRESSDDTIYGLWNHQDSFTIEAILSPYDMQGRIALQDTGLSSTSRTSGDKRAITGFSNTTSSIVNTHQNTRYISPSDRSGYKMCIFHSSKVKLYLVNTAPLLINRPAEYKLQFIVNLNGTDVTLESGTLISSSYGKSIDWSSLDADQTASKTFGFDENGKVQFEAAHNNTPSSNSGTQVVYSSDISTDFFVGQSLFIRDGFNFTEIGKVASISTTSTTNDTVNLDTSYSGDLTSTLLLTYTRRNPVYVYNSFHIAATFNNNSKEMILYFNGIKVASTTHTQTTDFAFEKEDFFLGANGNGATGRDTAKTNEQFMGVFHEFAFLGYASTQFTTQTLTPMFNNTLLYFRFEEVDE